MNIYHYCFCVHFFVLQKRRSRKRKSSENGDEQVAGSPESQHSSNTDKSQPQRRSTTPMAEPKIIATPNGYRSATPKPEPKKIPKKPKLNGFDRGEQVVRVLGASDVTGQLMFLVKFDENDSAEMIPSNICNVKCPQEVIQFYEERLVWHSDKESDDEEENDEDAEKDVGNGTAEEDNNSIAEENESADDD